MGDETINCPFFRNYKVLIRKRVPMLKEQMLKQEKRNMIQRELKCKILILLFLVLTFGARSQLRYANMELGIAAGGMSYLGDLNNQSMLGKQRPGGMLLFRYNTGQRWVVQFSGGYGQIEGGNPDVIKRRNLSFRSKVVDMAVNVQFNFLPFGKDGLGSYQWTPYLFAGYGFFGFNPKAEYTNPATGETQWYELQPLGTEGQGSDLYPDRAKYALIERTMPFGLGIKWKPTKYVVLGLEYGFRKTWTDYLDDVSTTYVEHEVLKDIGGDMSVVLSDRTGEVVPGYENAPGIQRGDDSLNDWYAFLGLTFTVRLDAVMTFFGWKPHCERGK